MLRLEGAEAGSRTDPLHVTLLLATTSSLEVSLRTFNTQKRRRGDSNTATAPHAPPMRSPDACWPARARWRGGSVSHRNNGSSHILDRSSDGPTVSRF